MGFKLISFLLAAATAIAGQQRKPEARGDYAPDSRHPGSNPSHADHQPVLYRSGVITKNKNKNKNKGDGAGEDRPWIHSGHGRGHLIPNPRFVFDASAYYEQFRDGPKILPETPQNTLAAQCAIKVKDPTLTTRPQTCTGVSDDSCLVLNPIQHFENGHAFQEELPIPGAYKKCFVDSEGRPVYFVNHTKLALWVGLRDSSGDKVVTEEVWGYQQACPGVNNPPATHPGSNFEAYSYKPIRVIWGTNFDENDEHPLIYANDEHVLCYDTSIDCGPFAPNCRPEVRNVPHVHGGHTDPQYDGHAYRWWTGDAPITSTDTADFNNNQQGPWYTGRDYIYHLDQPEAPLWYHDHSLGITRLNVWMGEAGFFNVRGPIAKRLRLPAHYPDPHCNGNEIELLFQDKSFDRTNGDIYYPGTPAEEAKGIYLMVNGMLWPKAHVKPEVYRLRFLVGADSRYFKFYFTLDELCPDDGEDLSATEERADLPIECTPFGSLEFTIIGSDVGFYDHPIITRTWIHGVAERVELLIDFAEHAGKSITLRNIGPGHLEGRPTFDFPDSTDLVYYGNPLNYAVRFFVGHKSKSQKYNKKDKCRPFTMDELPGRITTNRKHPPETIFRSREQILGEIENLHEYLVCPNNPFYQINQTGDGGRGDGCQKFGNPTTTVIDQFTCEEWAFIDTTKDSHQMHVHEVEYEIIGRRYILNENGTVRLVDNSWQFGEAPPLGPLIKPGPNELGPKDVAQAYNSMYTIIRQCFDIAGNYMWHCHLLSHEDQEMLGQFQVQPNRPDGLFPYNDPNIKQFDYAAAPDYAVTPVTPYVVEKDFYDHDRLQALGGRPFGLNYSRGFLHGVHRN